MIHLILGSLVLSLIHATIPNHWLPLVAVGRAQSWNRSETLVVTAVTGAVHASSTILIGVVVALLGYGLSGHAVLTTLVPPLALVGLGVVYIVLDLRGVHHHHHHEDEIRPKARVSKRSVVATLALAMFFSPCIEIEAYYLSAGFLGWQGVVAVSVTYLTVTVCGMVALVDLALRGAKRIQSHYLDHHEYKVTGCVLVALGLLTFFVGT